MENWKEDPIDVIVVGGLLTIAMMALLIFAATGYSEALDVTKVTVGGFLGYIVKATKEKVVELVKRDKKEDK